jgi:hypothetical protein
MEQMDAHSPFKANLSIAQHEEVDFRNDYMFIICALRKKYNEILIYFSAI